MITLSTADWTCNSSWTDFFKLIWMFLSLLRVVFTQHETETSNNTLNINHCSVKTQTRRWEWPKEIKMNVNRMDNNNLINVSNYIQYNRLDSFTDRKIPNYWILMIDKKHIWFQTSIDQSYVWVDQVNFFPVSLPFTGPQSWIERLKRS